MQNQKKKKKSNFIKKKKMFYQFMFEFVFSCLKATELYSLRRVCKNWHIIDKYLQHLDFQGLYGHHLCTFFIQISSTLVDHFYHKNLKVFNLYYYNDTNKITIFEFPSLQSLEIMGFARNILYKCPQVTKIILNNILVTRFYDVQVNILIHFLKEFPLLKILVINYYLPLPSNILIENYVHNFKAAVSTAGFKSISIQFKEQN